MILYTYRGYIFPHIGLGGIIMEIRISDTASEYLKNELRSKGLDKSLRVFVSGLG